MSKSLSNAGMFVFRVLQLEKKKEQISSNLKYDKALNDQNVPVSPSDSDEDDNDEELPEFLDWRAKKIHE